MRRRPRQPAVPEETSHISDAHLGNHFAWHAHEAIQSWTESVDVKSSIVLLVEIAVSGAAANALITPGGELHSAVGLHLATAIVALTSLSLSVACALWVVFPRLERRRTQNMSEEGLLYFGHLRTRSVKSIETALRELTPDQERHQLAMQLQITAQVAWRKHLWLQRSLALLALGAALLVVSFTAFG